MVMLYLFMSDGDLQRFLLSPPLQYYGAYGETQLCSGLESLIHLTAAVKSLHPSMCIAVHCSILLHPQLPWYHESAHHWELRDQV